MVMNSIQWRWMVISRKKCYIEIWMKLQHSFHWWNYFFSIDSKGVQLHCHLHFPIALEVSAAYVSKGQQLPWLGMPGQQWKEEGGIGQWLLVTIRDRLQRHRAGWPKGHKLGKDRQVGGIGEDHSRAGKVWDAHLMMIQSLPNYCQMIAIRVSRTAVAKWFCHVSPNNSLSGNSSPH